jgi:hypothetical protein
MQNLHKVLFNGEASLKLAKSGGKYEYLPWILNDNPTAELQTMMRLPHFIIHLANFTHSTVG